MTELNRRRFLKLALAGGLGAAAAAVRPPEALAATLVGGLKIHRESRLMMGTYVTITAVDESAERAAAGVAAALREMSRLEALLTRHDDAAPLAHLGRTGSLSRPEPEMIEVLAAARRFHMLSQGRFDITVAPLVDGVRDAFARSGQPPSEAKLRELMGLVDMDSLAVGQAELRLGREGMALTLDGLAKGYIVDRGIAALKTQGIGRALINAGGDIRALGRKDRAPWKVVVLDPTRTDHQGPAIDLADQAVATSGNYESYWDSEKLHHHIMNPSTGQSPIGPVSVSVKAADCLTADALATAAFLLPVSQALGMMRTARAAALIIDRGGHRATSPEWA